jgi:hypothetical protein
MEDDRMAIDDDVNKAIAEAKKVGERKEFMLHTVDKYDLIFGNKGYEPRIEQAKTYGELMEIAREMDELLNSDPVYRRHTDQVCGQIDNPMVHPNQRIHYPPGYFTHGRSAASIAKYGGGYKGRKSSGRRYR